MCIRDSSGPERELEDEEHVPLGHDQVAVGEGGGADPLREPALRGRRGPGQRLSAPAQRRPPPAPARAPGSRAPAPPAPPASGGSRAAASRSSPPCTPCLLYTSPSPRDS